MTPGAGRAGGAVQHSHRLVPTDPRPRPSCRWVAYQEVCFSGEQYVLEKGVYRNCDDWGAGNSALASLQPVLQVRAGRRGGAWGGWVLGPAERPPREGGTGRT